MVRVLVCGAGAVGARAARYLVADGGTDTVLVHDTDRRRQAAVVASLGDKAEAADEPDVGAADLVLLASPAARQAAIARRAVAAGRHVVSVADSVAAVKTLLDLHAEARGARRRGGRRRGLRARTVLRAGAPRGRRARPRRRGARRPPRHRRSRLRPTAPHGAAEHGLDWRDHGWRRRPPGSGRELCFFPDPIGGSDCYRAGLPDALLLVPAFPAASRVTARLAATRRDRFTAGLPMLRPPHAEGRIGGLRVEVRGRRGQARDTVVLGAVDRPAVAAGTVAGVTARWVADGQTLTNGAAGLATLVDPLPFLHELARAGVRAAVFEGT